MKINKNLKNHPWFKNPNDKRLNAYIDEEKQRQEIKKHLKLRQEQKCKLCDTWHSWFKPNEIGGWDKKYYQCKGNNEINR